VKNGWLRRLWPFLARHKRKVFTAFGVSLGTTIITVLIPLIERSVVDNVIVEQSQALWPLLVLLVGLGAINFVLSYIRRFVGGRFAFDVQHDLRTTIFERVQRLDFARHDQLPTGQVVSRANSDLALVQTLLSFLPLATGNVVLLVLSLVVMLVLSPLLTLIVLAIVPALLFVSLRLRRVMFPAQWDSLQRAGEVAGVVDEAVSGVRVVKGFGQEDRELAGLTDAAEGLYRSRVRTVRLQARYQSALQAIPALGQVGVLALGGWLAIEGQISIGTFLAFSTYLVQLLAPVRMFAGMVAVAEQARAGTERIFELIDSNPLVTERPDAPPLQVTTAEITFEHVSYGYLRSEPVLRDFSLRVAPGETIALVGASGSGKSTVSLLLPRFYDVQDGSIRIDGVNVRDVTLDSVRREIGIVFEDAFLFSDTVRTNIAYGRPDASDDDVERAARIAGAHEFVMELPLGYDTVVGERGLTLSGGQRQRISIARAVLTDPRVLVLDDATSSVDTRTEEQIHATLREIMADRTTVLIAHRRSTLRLADRIVLVADGRVAESGTHEELLASSPEYRALLHGPGDDLEDDEVVEPDRDAPDATGVTASLWDRTAEAEGVRAFIAPSGPAVARGGFGGSGASARGAGGGIALAPTPELLAAVDALPPADDEPDVDVAAEAAGSEHFRLRPFLRPYRRPLLIGFGLIVIDTLLTLAGPFLVQQGLNEGVQHHATGALWTASLLFLGATLVDWVVTWAYTRYTGRTAERLLFALRIRIFAHLQRLALDYYDREMSGRIMTRMTTDVDAFAQLLQTGLITAVVNILSFVGVLVVLSLLSWPLTLGVLVLVPPLLIATVWFGRRSAHAYAHARETISTVNAEFQESISGVREAQAYVREERNIESFHATARRYLDARLQTQVLQALYFPFILFLATCGDAVVLALGSALVHDGTIAAGTVIAFLLYLDQFFAPVQQLSQVFDQWQQAVASMTKINELMQTPVRTPDAVAPVVPAHLRGALCFKDVRFSYPGTGRETLHGIDLEVVAGETVALVGETGAGKSTLVKLVARFYDADSGQVLVDGVPVTDLDLRAYRRRLGYVPQEAFLFSGTVRDNIAYGRPDASDAEVERAARAVGAHDFIAGLRDGYLHPVTERGRSLSAGQRQLLCLARALLVDPAILLLDEATANLDLSTEARVQRAMGVVSRDRTTLLIAHRLQTARTADRIVVVDDGRIVETGSHAELLEQGGPYAELWNRNLDASISRYAASRPS
jgi:ATP-binding cassette, subfamily B, bacterial